MSTSSGVPNHLQTRVRNGIRGEDGNSVHASDSSSDDGRESEGEGEGEGESEDEEDESTFAKFKFAFPGVLLSFAQEDKKACRASVKYSNNTIQLLLREQLCLFYEVGSTTKRNRVNSLTISP